MRICFFTSLVLISSLIRAQQPLPQIGAWREHLPYNSAIDVTSGNGFVYCATPYSLFTVNIADKSISRLSKITGLSETGISTIRFDPAGQKLVIAYENSNIDIIYRNDIFNIPDIKRDDIIGDKRINNIYTLGSVYYLSSGLGIILIDAIKYEIKDTWFIGNGGNQVKVNGFTSDAGFYYAATEEGLKRIPINSPDPANYNNWQVLSPGVIKNVLNLNGKIIIHRNDSLLVYNNSSFEFFYAGGWGILNTNVSGGRLQLCERQVSGAARVVVLNENGLTERTLTSPGVISLPRKAISINSDVWVADQFGGLSLFSSSGIERFIPDSPQEKASGDILVYNSVFYAAAGAVNDSWNYQYNGDGIFILKDGSWTNINRYHYSVLDSMLDIIALAIDPRDESVWAGSFGGGLLHVKPGPAFEIFKQGYLGETVGDPGSYRVAGLAFDRENNLWISNFGSVQQLKVRKNDGNWVNISSPFFLSENAMSQIVIDQNNFKWIVSPLGNGLIVYDHGGSLESLADDRWRKYIAGSGNGNLPSNEVFCIALDKSGFIWVGTADGIAVIQCTADVFSSTGCEAYLPVVQQGSFAGFLFKGEEVRSIAVDGADRKWVATKNGAWLISANGEKIISHFTEENSPLLSNDVKKIAVDSRTGEVYFATMKGICSFRGTATEGTEENKDVIVFPNPVPPGFSGTIGIRGLVNNAIVKITELNGRLVHQSIANGGQATWNGRDLKGRKVSSGVYLVIIRDETGSEKLVTRIVVI